jgi:hypothetical protein
MKKIQCRGFEPTVFRLKNKVKRFAKNKVFYVPMWQYLTALIYLVNTLKNRTKVCLRTVGFANFEKSKGDKK